tara:strand:- start:2451 stop:2882 length:432 start_codon:yes stop_codon:yes gene_type:complete
MGKVFKNLVIEDLDLKVAGENLGVLSDIMDFLEQEDLEPEQDQVQEFLDKIILDEEDFCVELDGNEYRFIYEYAIDKIYEEEQMDFIEQELPNNLQSYIEIDWKATIKNLKDGDGFANWFASYDGEELGANLNEMFFYVFRIN